MTLGFRRAPTSDPELGPSCDGLVGECPMRAQFEDPKARRPGAIVAARWGAAGTPFQKLVQRRHLFGAKVKFVVKLMANQEI